MNLSGSPVDYIIAFLGGVLLSFTPCVYPLIPISISYIGVRSSGSKLKGFILGITYVSGVAVTYSFLGIVASLTGKIFGTISASPFSYIFAGLVVVIFGLSMLDLINLPLPSLVKLPALKKQNYLSTFLLGLTSGLIVSPCITPVLGSILLFLTTKKNILYGATLLFSFAYGMGLILIVAGVFSAVLMALPKSGKWMAYIKRFLAIILIVVGIYFLFVGIRRFIA